MGSTWDLAHTAMVLLVLMGALQPCAGMVLTCGKDDLLKLTDYGAASSVALCC